MSSPLAIMDTQPEPMTTETVSRKRTPLEPPPPTKFNFLSLGAGVQSSTLALMAAHGEVGPRLDAAIFADTQAEPQSVYRWLDWLEAEIQRCQYSFPIYRVTRGNLTESSLEVLKDDTGRTYLRRSIPVFGIHNGEITAAIGRKCTADYKIRPLRAKAKELAGVERGQKECTVTQWIGISWDEVQRMKESQDAWCQHRWPLIERRINRAQCLAWMREKGYPEPPRSACVYCPFHSDDEWRRLRDKEPDEFRAAVAFDEAIRRKFKENDTTLRMEVYLHNSCRPLGEIDFDSDEQKGQQVWDFGNECEGMCGM